MLTETVVIFLIVECFVHKSVAGGMLLENELFFLYFVSTAMEVNPFTFGKNVYMKITTVLSDA